jgi:predicted N-acetyltransferase YhbS
VADGDSPGLTELSIADALPEMQELASRTWTREARHHPGQLAWSYAYALPEELGHGPAAIVRRDGVVVAWAWAESDDWMELCVDPTALDAGDDVIAWFLERAGDGAARTMVLDTEEHAIAMLDRAGFAVEEESPWFTHHFLDLSAPSTLSGIGVPGGYQMRHVEPGEAAARAACHREAWSATSKVSTTAYERLMQTPPYRHDLDWVAVDADGRMVASVCVWLDARTGVALVEPVGCVPEHRRRGLAAAVSAVALRAAREAGATTALVCPRGDEGYPEPMRLYQRIGFEPGPRTLTFVRPSAEG